MVKEYENILGIIGNTPLIRISKIAGDIKSGIYVKPEFLNPGGSVKDRIGLLKDISQVVAYQKINMKSVTSDTKNRLYPLITVQISARTKPALEKLMVQLKKVNGVEEVGYKLL